MKAGTRRLLLVAAIAVLIAAATTVGYFVYAGGISNKVAEEKLRASRWFAQSLTVRIELESYWFDGPDVMRREHLDLAKLEKAGLVKIMGGDGGGAHAELTVEGQSAAASGWTRESDRLYFVTTATKEIDRVFDVNRKGRSASCFVAWNWHPTQVGRILGVDTNPKKSRVLFAKSEHDWSLSDVLAE